MLLCIRYLFLQESSNMNHTTWIEINKAALDHNIKQYQSWLPAQTAIAAVVKANAYGHGLVELGKLHQQHPAIIRLCVANAQEGVTLRQHGITKPILILGFINTPWEMIPQYKLDVIVSDLETLQQLNTVGQQHNTVINVHVKVDTGLSRLGFLPQDVPAAFACIQTLKYLNLQGLCSHFIEAFNKDLVHKQEDILKQFWQPGLQIHIANSNSSLHTKYTYSFARIGAGLYGYLPEADPSLQNLLQPVLSLKTRVISIKKVPAGSSVGYGSTTHVTTKPTTIAILGMGYFEGIDPDLSNFGNVIIHDALAPIIGRINMNYFMVDVTHIPSTHMGDIATLLGATQTQEINGYNWRIGSKKNVRIFLARLQGHIPRVIVDQPIVMKSPQYNQQSNLEQR